MGHCGIACKGNDRKDYPSAQRGKMTGGRPRSGGRINPHVFVLTIGCATAGLEVPQPSFRTKGRALQEVRKEVVGIRVLLTRSIGSRITNWISCGAGCAAYSTDLEPTPFMRGRGSVK